MLWGLCLDRLRALDDHQDSVGICWVYLLYIVQWFRFGSDSSKAFDPSGSVKGVGQASDQEASSSPVGFCCVLIKACLLKG